MPRHRYSQSITRACSEGRLATKDLRCANCRAQACRSLLGIPRIILSKGFRGHPVLLGASELFWGGTGRNLALLALVIPVQTGFSPTLSGSKRDCCVGLRVPNETSIVSCWRKRSTNRRVRIEAGFIVSLGAVFTAHLWNLQTPPTTYG